jgi:hypothetical protein
MKANIILWAATTCLLMAGCDRIGSEAWCEKQSQRPKEDWTLEEAADFTKYCVLHMDSEKFCKKLEEKPKGDWTANEAAEYARNCLTGRSD